MRKQLTMKMSKVNNKKKHGKQNFKLSFREIRCSIPYKFILLLI